MTRTTLTRSIDAPVATVFKVVADSHGTVWDTVFTVATEGAQTRLVMTMEARAHEWLPRLMNPLIKGMIAKAIAKDLDAIKAYCESEGP